MADTNIRFNIGSSFSGEGFEAASKAINENRKEIAASARGLGELTKAFEDLSPETATAVSAVKNFTTAFVTGGIVGGAIQLAIQGISKAVEIGVDLYHKSEEAVKKYADQMRENLMAVVTDSTDRLKRMTEEMDNVTQHAKDMAAAFNVATDKETRDAIYKVNIEKLQAITDEMTETERGILEAQATQKIAIIKCEASISKMTEALNTASVAYDEASRVQKEATLAAAKAEAALDIARNDRTLSEEQYQEFVKAAAESEKRLADANRAAEQAQLNLTRAADAQTAAYQDLEVTTKENALKVSEAIDRNVKAQEEEIRKMQEAQEKLSKELDKEAEKRATEAMKQLDEVMKMEGDLSEATKKLSDARKKAAEDTKEGDDGNDGKGKSGKITDVKVTNAKDIGSSFSTSVNIDGVNKNILKPKGLAQDVFNRIKSGTASVADFKAMDRFMAREERDKESSRHRIGADAARFISNADKPDSWLSQRDREFQDNFKTRVLPQLPKDVAKELLGDAGRHLLSTESMKEVLGNKQIIDAWLGKLGLK